jgi:hypothetical protein
VLPCIGKRPNARVADEIDQAGDGRKRSRNQTCTEQPNRCGGECGVGGPPVEEIAKKRSDEQTDGKCDQDRVDRVVHEICGTHRIAGVGSHG